MLKLKLLVSASALSALLLSSQLVYSASDEEVAALEARIAELETSSSWSSSDFAPQEDPLSIHGFLNAGVSSANTDAAGPVSAGIVDDLNHQAHQSFGLQVGYQLDKKTDLVAQILGRAYQDNMNVRMNWAYIGRTLFQDKGPMTDLKLRVGRAPADIYMISEYYDVGYAYPWVVPPRDAYDLLGGVPYDGADLIANFTLPANWNMQLKGFIGEVNVEPEAGKTGETDLDNIRGVNLIFERDAWRVRMGYAQSDVKYDVCCGDVADFDQLSGGYNSLESGLAELEAGIQQVESNIAALNPLYTPSYASNYTPTPITDTADNLSGSFSGLGVSYDDGTWLVMGEYTFQRWDTYNPDYDRAYLTVGRRFGEWMPYISAAQSKVEDEEDANELLANIEEMKAALDPDTATGAIADGAITTATAAADQGATDANAAIDVGEAILEAYATGDSGTGNATCNAASGGAASSDAECVAFATASVAQGQEGLAEAEASLAELQALEDGIEEFLENANTLSSSFGGLSLPQKTYSVGLRYDFAPGATAKLQVDKVTGFENTRGTLENAYVSHFAIQAAF